MLKFVTGDFFDFDADIMVNTVNCVGIMGAGVALAFKNKYPVMFNYYAEQCKAGEIRPGKPAVWLNRDMISKDIEIINFPTKDDWRKPSEYSYIEEGLLWLSIYLNDKEGKTITLPALGCGHGGLEWDKVKALIEKYLKNSPAEILIFEPSSSKNAGKSIKDLQKYNSVFASVGVNAIKASSSNYPASLRRYTNKDLFVYSREASISEYDFSLIFSSKPSEQERFIVERFMDICAQHGMSVLLGSSAYEKKLAFESSKRGLKVACFLPVGIYTSAKKLESNVGGSKLTLLSIGDPMDSFDKKEYLPSVLSRIYLAKKNLFITDRLSWLSKYERKLNKDAIQSYFLFHDDLKNEDVMAAVNSGSKKLALNFVDDKAVMECLFS